MSLDTSAMWLTPRSSNFSLVPMPRNVHPLRAGGQRNACRPREDMCRYRDASSFRPAPDGYYLLAPQVRRMGHTSQEGEPVGEPDRREKVWRTSGIKRSEAQPS